MHTVKRELYAYATQTHIHTIIKHASNYNSIINIYIL